MVARARNGLVNARKRQGHTQESLAHALNVEPSTVRRWERGTSDPLPLTWPRIAQELDITTDELVGFLGKPCCEKCGKVLAVDNIEDLCGACRRDQHGQLDEPPHVGDEFFDTAELQAAFESWHIGRVFRAYRAHPHFVGMFARPLTQENLGRWLGLNQNQMSKLETGKAEQNLELLQEWASILHLPQRMLWFDLPGQSRLRATPAVMARPESIAFADLTTVNRDSSIERISARDGELLLRLAEQTAFGPAELLQDSGQGRPVTEDDAAAIETATAMFRTWDNAQGGGLRRKAVIGQLADTTVLLDGPFESSQAARRCYSAVADLAQLAGWMTWDLQYHATAQNYYLLGLALARDAGDRSQIARMMYCLSRQMIDLGRPVDALDLAAAGSYAIRHQAPPKATALLLVAQARAHACLGAEQECRASLGAAQDAFTGDAPDREWCSFFDSAEFAGLTGVTLRDLALAAPDSAPRIAAEARSWTEKAANERSPAFLRSKILDTDGVAVTSLLAGEPDRAAMATADALALTSRLRSPRTIRRVTDTIAMGARTFPGAAPWDDLADRVQALPGAAPVA